MPRKKYTPEEIIQILRTVEIEQAKGVSQEDAAKKSGITVVTLGRWKKAYGGLRVDQAKRRKELEQENVRLKKLVARRIRSQDVILALADLFLKRGCPKHIRSDNGPEFVATKLRAWLDRLEVKPLFIWPGSPWENGYCGSFNGKMRHELLVGEIFFSLLEAKVIIERWGYHYTTKRPHSALGHRPPAPETFQQNFQGAEKYWSNL